MALFGRPCGVLKLCAKKDRHKQVLRKPCIQAAGMAPHEQQSRRQAGSLEAQVLRTCMVWTATEKR